MDYRALAQEVVARATRAGADEADVWVQTETEFSVQVRKGEIETLSQASSKGLGLRLFKDKRLGFASTSDFAPEALDRLIETTLGIATFADPKEENALADTDPAFSFPDLALYDPAIEQVPTEVKIEMAMACERASFAADSRITNSEGAGFGSVAGETVLANSQGLVASYRSSSCSLYCQPLAEQDGKKQVDYDYAYVREWRKMESAEAIGLRAAERVLRKLGAKKVPTQTAPVVFDRRVASRIWAEVLGAVNGDAVFKGMSYLRDRLGDSIASEIVTLVDDGTLPGAVGSAPFDGEGLPTQRNVIIENGTLKMFLYDTATARKAGNGIVSTHNARRSTGGAGGIGAFNLLLLPGEQTPEELIGNISNGFLVTSVMGGGANTVTGDYSIGASGLWIEDGKPTFAVEEVTIAGTMDAILKGIDRIANDVVFHGTIVSPSFSVAEMTIAGS